MVFRSTSGSHLTYGFLYALKNRVVGVGEHGNVVCLPRLIDGPKVHGARSTRRRVFLLGSAFVLLIGVAIFPFRTHEYGLEFLLVLPVLFAGALAGRTVAVVTALVAVFTFHLVTRTGSTKVEEDVIALVTFLASALAVGAAVGGSADRLTLAREHAREQERLRDLSAQVAEAASRVAVLEQVDKQRIALLRSVSHDLRTPLATIRAVATDLRDANVHDEATRQQLLKSVSDEAERLDRLVGNLLNMSRIEAGSMHVDDQAVDLAEVVELAALRLSPVMSRVQLEVEVEPKVPFVTGDPVLLDEVVSNLLENAARYAPAGSAVVVRLAAPDDGSVMLQVCDHGPGVADADLDRVFEPFWRGADSRSSGLGLAIVRAVVDAHGGSIALQHTPGGGATFEVSLPARQDATL
jgi:K+-sensing histidine kinase KdpD